MAQVTERFICIKAVVEENLLSSKGSTYNRITFELPDGYKYSSFLRGNENISVRKLLENYDIEGHVQTIGKGLKNLNQYNNS